MLKGFNFHIGEPNKQLGRMIHNHYQEPWFIQKEPSRILHYKKNGIWIKQVMVEEVDGEHVIWKIQDGKMKRIYDKQLLRTTKPF